MVVFCFVMWLPNVTQAVFEHLPSIYLYTLASHISHATESYHHTQVLSLVKVFVCCLESETVHLHEGMFKWHVFSCCLLFKDVGMTPG